MSSSASASAAQRARSNELRSQQLRSGLGLQLGYLSGASCLGWGWDFHCWRFGTTK